MIVPESRVAVVDDSRVVVNQNLDAIMDDDEDLFVIVDEKEYRGKVKGTDGVMTRVSLIPK